MNRIEEFEKEKQEIVLKNRKDLSITGVKKLESLNPMEFVVHTNFGKMIIKGQDLEMQALDVDKGNLIIVGKVRLIEYSDKVEAKTKEKGFLTKLFK